VWESIYHRIRGYRYQFISDFCFNTLDLLNKGGFFKNPLAWASDDITVYKAEESLGIANTNNPVFLYRKNSQNISSTGSIDIMLDAIDKEVQWLYSFVIEHVPNNTKDEYIKSQILSYLPRYIYKKKSMTLSGEYSSGVLKGIFKNCRRLYKNNLNIKHLFISIALYLKDD